MPANTPLLPTIAPGTRVSVTQPKMYGTGPSDTETTTHYGAVELGGIQTPDIGKIVVVRIDSGASIIYPRAYLAAVA